MQSPRENSAFRDIDPEKDWGYEGIDSTLQQYMEKHPPHREQHKEQER